MTGTVLIADQNAANRIVLRSMTTGLFDSARMASTADEVLQQLAVTLPDLIVIAADMARGGFAELMTRIRVMAPGVPLLVVVPEAMPARIAAFDAGADDVMAQPLDQALFRARARRLMRAHHGPAVSRIAGLAEAAAQFSGLVPVSLLGAQGSARDRLVQDMRRFGLSVSQNAAAARVTLFWGLGQTVGRATSLVAANSGPVVCILPGLPPAEEIQLLDAGAADVQSGPPEMGEIRSRLLRVLPPAPGRDGPARLQVRR